MRHIPDDELHAYLDQALSRSQCVEIERHLAGCPSCQVQRDEAAALRDRTTAILTPLAPDLVIPPSYSDLEARYRVGHARHLRWVRGAAWAATTVFGLGLGWQANHLVHRVAGPRPAPSTVATLAGETGAHLPATAAAPETSNKTPAPVPAPAPVPERSRSKARAGTQPAERPAPEHRLVRMPGGSALDPELSSFSAPSLTSRVPIVATGGMAGPPDQFPELEVSGLPAQLTAFDGDLSGVWRAVAPDSVGTVPTTDVARVPGLPVIQWRVQAGGESGDLNAVDQLLDNGQLIRTISGPADRVAALVEAEESSAARRQFAGTPADRMTVTVRQGSRMLAVTGPAQALGALLSRVTGGRRY